MIMSDKKTYHIFHLARSENMDSMGAQHRSALMRARLGQIDDALALDLYDYIGAIEARNEEGAFYKTQNFNDETWADRDVRCTGVGDIIVDADSGDSWMCASCGWEILSWDRCAALLLKVNSLDADPELEMAPAM
jgi:hypothetical protein